MEDLYCCFVRVHLYNRVQFLASQLLGFHSNAQKLTILIERYLFLVKVYKHSNHSSSLERSLHVSGFVFGWIFFVFPLRSVVVVIFIVVVVIILLPLLLIEHITGGETEYPDVVLVRQRLVNFIIIRRHPNEDNRVALRCACYPKLEVVGTRQWLTVRGDFLVDNYWTKGLHILGSFRLDYV